MAAVAGPNDKVLGFDPELYATNLACLEAAGYAFDDSTGQWAKGSRALSHDIAQQLSRAQLVEWLIAGVGQRLDISDDV
jgi:hypothetical protein